MNTLSIKKHGAASALLSAAILALTGCGGGSPQDYAAQAAGVETVSGSPAAQTPTITAARTDTSSFTLNSTAEFKGFNPQIWDNHRTWYECDCGKNSQQQPKTMPWNTTG